MNVVKVIIPVYRTPLSELEERSLAQACQVLGAYPLVVIHPESLDPGDLATRYPALTFTSFADHFFQGISGYNRLMLSAIFYERFLDSTYILIYQLDAYVFRDELASWCAKEYDYVGAPWLCKPIYRLPLISTWMRILRGYAHSRGRLSKQDLYGKIGNGGLSLRRVESHYRATICLNARIQYYLEQKRCHFYNEDVFWATEKTGFSYPPAREAIYFSFDKYPAYCYRLTGKRLPFGCHSWYKRKMKRFWKPIIGF